MFLSHPTAFLFSLFVLISWECVDYPESSNFEGKISGDLAAKVYGDATVVRWLSYETGIPVNLEMQLISSTLMVDIFVLPSDSEFFHVVGESSVVGGQVDSGVFVLIHDRELNEVYQSTSGLAAVTRARKKFVHGTLECTAVKRNSDVDKSIIVSLDFKGEYSNRVLTSSELPANKPIIRTKTAEVFRVSGKCCQATFGAIKSASECVKLLCKVVF